MSSVDQLTLKWVPAANRPVTDMYLKWFRFVLYGSLIYKLLSRDFSNFGYYPEFLLDLYPADVYGINDYRVLAVGWWVDLWSFHWLHWFLPFPDPETFRVFHISAIVLCGFTIFFGQSTRLGRGLPLLATFVLFYLWGFLWRSASDIDSVFLIFQLCFVYSIFPLRDRRLFSSARNRECCPERRLVMACVLIVFVGFYFPSGINKLTDISLIEWFTYDLSQEMLDLHLAQTLGYYYYAPDFFKYVSASFIDFVGPPIVYLSHFLSVLLLYKRRMVSKFLQFYWTFHIFTWLVGINFLGTMLGWLTLIPVDRLGSSGIVDGNCRHIRIQKIIDSVASGKTENEREFETFEGWFALRRLAWSKPQLWPLIPVLYFLPISILAELIMPKTWIQIRTADVG